MREQERVVKPTLLEKWLEVKAGKRRGAGTRGEERSKEMNKEEDWGGGVGEQKKVEKEE